MNSTRDLTRTTLAVLFVGALIASTVWIMRPFLTALLWAAMIVISTWPILLWLQARLWGRRALATTCMIAVLLLVLVIPLSVSVGALVSNMSKTMVWVHSLREHPVPPLPHWLTALPVVGVKASAGWDRITSEGPDGLIANVLPYTDRILAWFASAVGGIGAMILQFLLTVIISGVLYTYGETAARGVRDFAHRLAGASGEKAAILAANSVRGVAVGVLVTAITQTAISGAGLLIVSVPATPVIAAAVLVFCLAQLGPILVMIPVVIWTYYTRDTFWAGLLLVFTLVAGAIDNFLRPVLIRRGADLPILLILAGVIGGMVGLGVMGIFVGPVILAVSYTLIQDWIASGPKSEPPPALVPGPET